MTTEAWIGVGTILASALIWFIRLEGRVNTHEKGCEERQKRLDERHAHISKTLDAIDAKLDRLAHHSDTSHRSEGG